MHIVFEIDIYMHTYMRFCFEVFLSFSLFNRVFYWSEQFCSLPGCESASLSSQLANDSSTSYKAGAPGSRWAAILLSLHVQRCVGVQNDTGRSSLMRRCEKQKTFEDRLCPAREAWLSKARFTHTSNYTRHEKRWAKSPHPDAARSSESTGK